MLVIERYISFSASGTCSLARLFSYVSFDVCFLRFLHFCRKYSAAKIPNLSSSTMISVCSNCMHGGGTSMARDFSSCRWKTAADASSSWLSPPSSSSSHLPTRMRSREHTLKRQKGMWGSESVCQRSGVSLRRRVLPSPALCQE